jgi:hypothetical protein
MVVLVVMPVLLELLLVVVEVFMVVAVPEPEALVLVLVQMEQLELSGVQIASSRQPIQLTHSIINTHKNSLCLYELRQTCIREWWCN